MLWIYVSDRNIGYIMPNMGHNSGNITVSALYHFALLEDFEALKTPFLKFMESHNIKGTILIAREGINGTVAGTHKNIKAFHDFIKSDERLAGTVTKESYFDEFPFHRTKVKLKKEIVTMGIENIDPNEIVGTYVKPADWNALISDPDVIIVDTRNDYEIGIGTFKNALNPDTTTFREFPAYVDENLKEFKDKKIAMFCTGGIRCEKSTAYLKQQGFGEVFHLEGGVLKYLEEIPQNESLWEGECFVFDSRVSVKHNLEKGIYDQCFACRMPITEDDKTHEYYMQGVSCHHCCKDQTEDQRRRYKEREKQVSLSKKRGKDHIGGSVEGMIAQRRAEKNAYKESQKKIKHG